MSIYEDADLEQKFADGSTRPSNWTPNENEIYEIENQDKYIYTFKGMKGDQKAYSAYGYKSDALVLVQTSGKWEAITTVEALKAKWGS